MIRSVLLQIKKMLIVTFRNPSLVTARFAQHPSDDYQSQLMSRPLNVVIFHLIYPINR